jgi:NADPH-dependent ferric siderophore reductase
MSEMPRAFTATAEVALPSPGQVMRGLCARISEFGEISGHGRCRRIETGFGTADIEDCGRCLRICAAATDEAALAYVKLAMAEHLISLLDSAPSIVWLGDGPAGSPLPYFREMRVKRSIELTPHMRRVTLTGSDLSRFASGGLHVRLLLPKDRNRSCQWPVMGEDGRPKWPAGEDKPDIRIYTLRRVDPGLGEVDIDFVLHEGDSPGARFARQAGNGDVVGMTGPGGGGMPSSDWCLLLGDETALPAIGRMLEELPAHTEVVARIEVAGESEIQPLPERRGLDLRWLVRDGKRSGLLQPALESITWPRDGRSVFAWAGCEYRDFLAIRRHFRIEHGLARQQHLAVAYWRRGYSGDDARKDG